MNSNSPEGAVYGGRVPFLGYRNNESYINKVLLNEITTSHRRPRNQTVSQSLSYTKNSLKVEDTVHLSSVFGYLFPILL